SDIMRIMSQEVAADPKTLKTFRDLLTNATSKIENIKTDYEALGPTEKDILKTEKDAKITQLETAIIRENEIKITKAKTVDDVKTLHTAATDGSVKLTDAQKTNLDSLRDTRITELEDRTKIEIKDKISRAKTIDVVESLLEEARKPELKFTPVEMVALETDVNNKITSLTQQAFSRAKTAIEAATEITKVQEAFDVGIALAEITDTQKQELVNAKKAKDIEIEAKIKADEAIKSTKEAAEKAADRTHAEKLAETKAKSDLAAAKATASAKVGSGINLTVNTVAPADTPAKSTRKIKPSTDIEKAMQDDLDRASASREASFEKWKSKLPVGYTVEVKDGKAELKDTSGESKGIFDPHNVKERAKIFRKIKP
ncbi:MAG: hypothetical protein Q8K26_00700, partial [Candidatus Gracilibacteria bacterium]|nr:hypothetical protein [Candidatus Gracilibacteria bacterium]